MIHEDADAMGMRRDDIDGSYIQKVESEPQPRIAVAAALSGVSG